MDFSCLQTSSPRAEKNSGVSSIRPEVFLIDTSGDETGSLSWSESDTTEDNEEYDPEDRNLVC